MALKQDDILLVQRGTTSYQMPASQLASADFVGGDLQAVTDRGATTNNKIDITGGPDTVIDGKNWKLNLNLAGSGTNLSFANILDGGFRYSALGNNNTGGTLDFFVNVAGEKKTTVRIPESGGLRIGMELHTNQPTIALNNNGSASFAEGVCQVDAAGYIIVDRTSAGQTIIEGKQSGTQTSRILANGSANFAGGNGIDTDDSFGIADGGNINVRRPTASNAAIQVRDADGAAGVKFAIHGDGTTSIGPSATHTTGNIQLKPNGAGFFANGDIKLNETGGATFASENVTIDTSGKLTVKRTDGDTNAVLVLSDGSDAAQTVFYGNGQATFVGTQIQFYTDGTATFAGNVAVGGSVGNQTVNGVYLNKDGYVASTGSGTTNIWNGYQNGTAGQTSVISADGQAIFNARVSGTMTDIDATGAFDMKDSNFWTVAGPTLGNPTSRTAGQTGVFYCTGEVNAFGDHYSFSGGVTPTIPANSVVPYFVDAAEKIRLGIATEAFV